MACGPATEGPDLAPMAQPTLYVDISDAIEAKKQAMLAIAPSMGMTEASIDAGIARSKGQDELTHVDHAESFHALHTPVIDLLRAAHQGPLAALVAAGRMGRTGTVARRRMTRVKSNTRELNRPESIENRPQANHLAEEAKNEP